jgi:hypothetical protein
VSDAACLKSRDSEVSFKAAVRSDQQSDISIRSINSNQIWNFTRPINSDTSVYTSDISDISWMESGYPRTAGSSVCSSSAQPSFVITLSWHTSVKKVALSTPKSLTSAQQTPQFALCAVVSRGDGFVYNNPASCSRLLRSGDPHSRQSEPRSPCSPLAEQPCGRERHHWRFARSQADGSDTILTTQCRHHRCSYRRS